MFIESSEPIANASPPLFIRRLCNKEPFNDDNSEEPRSALLARDDVTLARRGEAVFVAIKSGCFLRDDVDPSGAFTGSGCTLISSGVANMGDGGPSTGLFSSLARSLEQADPIVRG